MPLIVVLFRRITDSDRESVDACKKIPILLCIYRFFFFTLHMFLLMCVFLYYRKVIILILLKIVVLLYISIGFHKASIAFGNTAAQVFYNFPFNKSLQIKLPLKWFVFLEYKSYISSDEISV